jgi:hypothetical protein
MHGMGFAERAHGSAGVRMTNRIGQATPGPWVVETHHRQGHDRMVTCWYVLTPHNRVGIAAQPAFSDDTNAEANALLIAAAPDMFEALAGMIGRYAKAGPFDELLGASEQTHETNAALAALARARGEQPAREQVL